MISYTALVAKHYILQTNRVTKGMEETGLSTSFQGFYIECNRGWFDLLDKLCTDIEKILNKDKLLKDTFMINQIKDKFGGLRFYTDSVTDEIDKLIVDAEDKSFTVCEICGENAKKHIIRGWITTLCDKCAKKSYTEWVKSLKESMISTLADINRLNAKENKTTEEIQELSEAREWFDSSNEQIIEINMRLKQ